MVLIYQRYVLAFMSFLAVAIGYFMRMSFNLALVVMAPHFSGKIDPHGCPGVINDDNITKKYDFDWDERTQGIILSSFYIGYLLTHIPAGMLAEKFGGKHTLGFGILITAFLTLCTPLVAYQGPVALSILRALIGAGEGTMFPGLNQLLAAWIPLSERGKIGSFVFAGVQMGSMASLLMTGYLLSFTNDYWPAVFYVYGSMGIIWFIVWFFICSNDPGSHPFISQKEKDYLEQAIGSLSRRKDLPSTPWKAILTNPPVLALLVASMGHDWGLFTINTDLPKYMSSVLKFSIASNGLLSSLPFLSMFLFAIGSGWLSDKMLARGILSVTNNRKLFTTIASVGPALGIILASYAGCNKVIVIIFFTLGMGLMGCYYPSIRVNTLDLAPNYAGTLMALVNGLGSISGIVAPMLVGFLAPDNTMMQWRLIFWITFFVLIATNIVFIIGGSAKLQKFNGDVSPTHQGEPVVMEPE